MNNLQERKVFVPKDVNKELPKEGDTYFVERNEGDINIDCSVIKFNPNQQYWYEPNVTHWLKEENKITLSKEELIELVDDAMTAGKNWAETYASWFIPTTEQHKEKFEHFLESKGLSENKNQNQK